MPMARARMAGCPGAHRQAARACEKRQPAAKAGRKEGMPAFCALCSRHPRHPGGKQARNGPVGGGERRQHFGRRRRVRWTMRRRTKGRRAKGGKRDSSSSSRNSNNHGWPGIEAGKAGEFGCHLQEVGDSSRDRNAKAEANGGEQQWWPVDFCATQGKLPQNQQQQFGNER